jgi:hypothetical protein
MGGMRSVLTGFAVGTVIGAGGYLAAAGIAVSPRTAMAQSAVQAEHANRLQNQIVIADEHGGSVVDYALQMLTWRERGISLRFTGRCDSACTLYLALPYEQTCVAAGASFRFHAPTAETEISAKLALNYMTHNYPHWVNSWIEAMGGLSDRLITMDYEYARQFMRSCEPNAPTIVMSAGEKPS